jgi:LPPG:FO 2-phospho-L-lactate transferase
LILALAGGVGGARLANGLAQRLASHELVVAVNTGDDFEHLGLAVSPDLDTVMYTLAGRSDTARGWGLAGETWRFMEALEALGGETWFRLGGPSAGVESGVLSRPRIPWEPTISARRPAAS